MTRSPLSFLRLLLVCVASSMMLAGFDCEPKDPCDGPDACMDNTAGFCFSLGDDVGCACQCEGGRVVLTVYDQFGSRIKEISFGYWVPHDPERKSYCTLSDLPACENLSAEIHVICDQNCFGVEYSTGKISFRAACGETVVKYLLHLQCTAFS